MQPLDLSFLTPQTLSLPLDILKTVLVVLASIVLAPTFHILHSSTLRHLYSCIPSFFLMLFLLENWFFFIFGLVIISYLMFLLIPKQSYIGSFVLGFAALLFIHSYRFMVDYLSWKVDCSVLVMILVTKIIYYGMEMKKNKSKVQVLPYLGYCFFFPSVFIGPTFSYSLYQNFASQNKPVPLAKIVILTKFGQAILLSAITAVMMPIFTPTWVLQNETYLSLPSFVKLLSLNLIGICYRMKFYSAWALAQTSINLSGISWNEKTQKFDKVITGSFNFETEPNPKYKTQYWNTSVQNWLKDCFYDPIHSGTGSSEVSTYATFIISAFWHGIYWTYYVGFFQWALVIQINKWFYKISQSLSPKLANSFFVKVFSFLTPSTIMNYIGMFIVLLSWNEALRFYEDMSYIGSWILGIFFVLTLVIKPKKAKK